MNTVLVITVWPWSSGQQRSVQPTHYTRLKWGQSYLCGHIYPYKLQRRQCPLGGDSEASTDLAQFQPRPLHWGQPWQSSRETIPRPGSLTLSTSSDHCNKISSHKNMESTAPESVNVQMSDNLKWHWWLMFFTLTLTIHNQFLFIHFMIMINMLSI